MLGMKRRTQVSPKDVLDLLIEALKAIYYTAGREVIYETENGEIRHYWPKRYWQALKRAIANDDVVGFVEGVVTRDEPTRGFGYLEAAGRLDLTVEALVADETRPWHSLFSQEAVDMSRRRLAGAEARLAGQPATLVAPARVEYVDKAVSFEVDLPQSVMSVDRQPVRVTAGRYDVSLMRHWASRLDANGLRAGDIWYLVGMPNGRGAWVRAAECAMRP
jgi:hypothetical protein